MRTSGPLLSANSRFAKMAYVLLSCAAMATASPAQTLTTLHSFAGRPNDGADPYAGLVQGADGNFYGTTYFGGANNDGTVFRITPSGSVTILHSFAGSDGREPTAGLIQASDGNFYGTTSSDGTGGSGGTVFKITPNGTLTTLATFNGQGGPEFPYAGLIQASDGNFYGTTTAGGTQHGNGTAFKITPNGTVTTLYSFACTEGCHPNGGLVQGSDGNFYGTTRDGGTNGFNYGTVFKITADGTLTLLHTFEGNDGGEPYAALIQAADGNFYGTTTGAGAHNAGTIFKITPSGSLTTLYSFCPGGYPCADGETPYGELVKATDGNFYGTTYVGGANNVGTIFQITPSGMLTTMHSFNGGDGAGPEHGLVQATDGNFYGTTSTGGASGDGTVFRLVGLPASTTTVTSSPNPSMSGELVTITATVGPPGPPLPTGTVGFTSNGVAIPGCTAVTLNSSRTAVCTTTGLAVGTDAIVATYSGDSNYTGSSGMTSQIVNPLPMAVQFVPVTPCRVVDTRNPNGPFGGPPISGHSSRAFPLSEGDNPCSIPASAIAYSLNVTVVPMSPLNYLTIWPTGQGQPTVSTLNSPDGRVKADAAIVPAGTPSGSVSVYVTQYGKRDPGHQWLFHSQQQLDAGVLSADAVPCGGHAPVRLEPAAGAGTADDGRYGNARSADSDELVFAGRQPSEGVFVQRDGGAESGESAVELSDGVAERPAAAERLDAEQSDGDSSGQRSDCAGGREQRQHQGVHHQQYGCGHGHQRLLCSARGEWLFVLCGDAVPGLRQPQQQWSAIPA